MLEFRYFWLEAPKLMWLSADSCLFKAQLFTAILSSSPYQFLAAIWNARIVARVGSATKRLRSLRLASRSRTTILRNNPQSQKPHQHLCSSDAFISSLELERLQRSDHQLATLDHLTSTLSKKTPKTTNTISQWSTHQIQEYPKKRNWCLKIIHWNEICHAKLHVEVSQLVPLMYLEAAAFYGQWQGPSCSHAVAIVCYCIGKSYIPMK